MAEHPAALQVRLLQTVVEVAAEKNSTLVLPFPVELLRFLERATPPEVDRPIGATTHTIRPVRVDGTRSARPDRLPTVRPRAGRGSPGADTERERRP